GKSSDKYDSVYYFAIGSPQKQNLSPKYSEFLREYGYTRTDSLNKASLLLTDDLAHDSINGIKAISPDIKVFTYVSIQRKLERKVDGIIETAKNAVIDIIIPLIGIMALFMGF